MVILREQRCVSSILLYGKASLKVLLCCYVVTAALQAFKRLKLFEGSLQNTEVADGIIFTAPVTMETGERNFNISGSEHHAL